jgi:tRNA pseudouridine13 synthase
MPQFKGSNIFDLGLVHALGTPGATARIRVQPEDFSVEEALRFEPAGEGAHAWLRIEKRAMDTLQVARLLARQANVRPVDVGYAGLKDRHALTTQWFSVNLGGRADPDWCTLESDGLKVLSVTRHAKKLRRGQIRENRFRITLRAIRGDRDALDASLNRIATCGVPNYFGPQRFGRDAGNLKGAVEMFSAGRRVRNRQARGMYLSAARAQVFNRVLCERVASGNWNRALNGDLLMFDDSRSRFLVDDDDATRDPRLERLELHPTGPLWGRGSPDSAGAAAEIERRVSADLGVLTEGLESAGLDADRRALRLAVRGFAFEAVEDDALTLSFALRPGSYATAVLFEIAEVSDAASDQLAKGVK